MRARSSRIAVAAAVGLLATVSACADRTAILVEVTSADLSVPVDVDAITIRAQSAFDSLYEHTFPLSASWPHSLTILPVAREGIGPVRIDVTGHLAGGFVVRRIVSTEFVPGVVRRVSVVLARACSGVRCADGIDCISGVCVDGAPDAGMPDAGGADGGALDAGSGEDVPTPLDAPMSMDVPTPLDAPMSMDVPSPVDAGPPDAGPPDGGPPDAGPPDAGPLDAGAASPPIFFSEYVEGSASNKVLEIFNGGTTALDLSTCDINLYSNGSLVATPYTALTGTLAPGDVFVLCHGGSSAALLPSCDMPLGPSGGALAFNGDDAVELVCGGVRVDVFGQIGVDPGAAWGAGATSTLDTTLRRSCSVTRGDTNGSDAFVPAAEWAGFPTDTFAGLGMRGCP